MYVPPRVVTNDDLREQYGMDTSDEWIRQRTGIEQRHFADEGTFDATRIHNGGRIVCEHGNPTGNAITRAG